MPQGQHPNRPQAKGDFHAREAPDLITRHRSAWAVGLLSMGEDSTLLEARVSLRDLLALLIEEGMADGLPGLYHLDEILRSESMDKEMRDAARSTYRSVYYNKEGLAHMGIWKEPYEERVRVNHRLKELSQALLQLIDAL